MPKGYVDSDFYLYSLRTAEGIRVKRAVVFLRDAGLAGKAPGYWQRAAALLLDPFLA